MSTPIIPDDIPRDTLEGVEYLRLPAAHPRKDTCYGCSFHHSMGETKDRYADDSGCSKAQAAMARGALDHRTGDKYHLVFVKPEQYAKWAEMYVRARLGGDDGNS
jgi:hypothetical protein